MVCVDDLSPQAQALVRRLLRSIIKPYYYDYFAAPEKVVLECIKVGLLIQEEDPLHEPRFVYPLNGKKFRQRAMEIGFVEAAEAAKEKE